jgi:hypothetical protein
MFNAHESEPRRKSSDYRLLWSLTLAGVVSGILSILLPLSLTFVGAWLGLVVSAYLWIFRGFRSVARALGFAATSAAAFYAALMATIFLPLRIRALDLSDASEHGPHTDVFFSGGVVGGFLVFLSAFLLFCPKKKTWRSILEALLWSLPCGILGVAGWALGSTFGRALCSLIPFRLNPGDTDEPFFRSLFLVWQTGAGFLLGFALALEEERSSTAFLSKPPSTPAPRPKDRLSIAGMILIACAVLTLSWLLINVGPREYSNWRWHRAWEKHLAQTPTLQNLPAVQAMPLDRALVLREIGSYTPRPGRSGQVRYPIPGYPPTMEYAIDYLDPGLPPPPESRPVAEIEIRQYPNAAWAKFELWDLPIGPRDPETAPKVTKAGNRLMTIDRASTGGDEYYYWVSGACIIAIRVHDVNSDSFLREYLALYPSSP